MPKLLLARFPGFLFSSAQSPDFWTEPRCCDCRSCNEVRVADYRKILAGTGQRSFCYSGSPLDPRCHGTNHLIRQGAALVQFTQDILQGLEKPFHPSYREQKENSPSFNEITSQEFNQTLHQARQVILENLSFTPIQVDELIRGCHFSHAIVTMVLLELELAGRLNRHAGHQVSLRGDT